MHFIPNAIYHKKLQCWEIPVTSLSRSIDSLQNLDELHLKFNKEELDIDVKNSNSIDSNKFKTKPYKYQLDGINYGMQSNHNKWLLLDAPGLGKSLQMIYLVVKNLYMNIGQVTLKK